MSKTILCTNCRKDSGIERTDSDGTNGFLVSKFGWYFKIPVMLGIPETWILCSKECHEEIRARKIDEYKVSPETIAEAHEHCEKFKEKIPQMVEETAQVVSKFQKVLLGNLKKKKHGSDLVERLNKKRF